MSAPTPGAGTYRHHLLLVPGRNNSELVLVLQESIYLLVSTFRADAATHWPAFTPWNSCCETGMKSCSVATKKLVKQQPPKEVVKSLSRRKREDPPLLSPGLG